MKNSEPIRVAQIMGKWLGGGVESFVMNYYRHIDKNKIQFDFLCDEDSTNIPYDEIEKLGGRVILIPPYQKVFKYQKVLKKIFVENKYSIVHSHINTLSVFPLFAAKCAGVTIRIAHSHATTNRKEFKRNIIKQILRPLTKIIATHYMSCSEYAGRWMFGNKNYQIGKVKVINNAININSFDFNFNIRKQYRKMLNINDDQIVIGHVGRMVTTKNHQFILNLFAELIKKENAILILIGQGPLETSLKKQAVFLGIKDKVLFLGQRDDVNNLYQSFDLFLLPSLYEGFGMALLEAQVSNLPCIASTGVPKETKIISDFEFLSLDLDVSYWIDTILRLIKNNNRMSNKQIIKSRGFDISCEANKLSKYYADLIKEDNLCQK